MTTAVVVVLVVAAALRGAAAVDHGQSPGPAARPDGGGLVGPRRARWPGGSWRPGRLRRPAVWQHPESDELRRLADVADRADRAHRADAENDLSRALSAIPAASDPDLAAELADAGERVVLARRFYNDAVRDTRALRAVLFTRIFGLAGRAALPDYFEIAEVSGADRPC